MVSDWFSIYCPRDNTPLKTVEIAEDAHHAIGFCPSCGRRFKVVSQGIPDGGAAWGLLELNGEET